MTQDHTATIPSERVNWHYFISAKLTLPPSAKGRTESTCCAHPLGAIKSQCLGLTANDLPQAVIQPLQRNSLFLGVVVAVVDLCDVIDRVIEYFLDVKSGDT